MSQSEDEQQLVDYDEEEQERDDSLYVPSTDSDDPTDLGLVRYSSDTLSYDEESRITVDAYGKIILDPNNKFINVGTSSTY